MLLHMWLIEVYARRQQAGTDYDTPEERWLAGLSNPKHQPQPLTKEEAERWDLIPCLELDLQATREGIRWNNLFYQSTQLQDVRARSGCHGPRVQVPTPVRVRISRCSTSADASSRIPTALEHGNEHLPKEFDVESTDEKAHGLNRFQWETYCKFRLAKKHAPTPHVGWENGFNHLFETAIDAMGMVPTDQTPPKTIKLSDGRNPRLAGVLAYGAERHALAGTEELIDKIGMLKQPQPKQRDATSVPPPPLPVPTTDVAVGSSPVRKKIRFEVDAPLVKR